MIMSHLHVFGVHIACFVHQLGYLGDFSEEGFENYQQSSKLV